MDGLMLFTIPSFRPLVKIVHQFNRNIKTSTEVQKSDKSIIVIFKLFKTEQNIDIRESEQNYPYRYLV